MKKLKTMILVIPVLILAVSCGEDFTILAPQSERNAENFYRTDTDFVTAINGAYAALADRDAYGRNYTLLFEMRGDNTSNGGGDTGLAETLFRLESFSELTDATELETTWAGAYRGISATNTILSRLENVNLTNSDLEDRIKGEALFIRSLFYYNLAVIFGNVPLQLEEVTGPSIDINQVDAEMIYARIADDLEEAEGLLPSSYTGADVGRATSGAAATLLGLVELTAGNNSQAEAALRRVVDSEEYELVADYADLWGPSNENNIESIFEIQYKAGGTGTGSSYTEFYTPFGTSGGVGGGNAPQVLTDDMFEIFEEEDDRFWGGTLDSVLLDGDEEYTYYVKKFESTPFDAFDADNNFVVFRYADVLLMLAEAIGESAEAYSLINEVRSRAGLTDPVETLEGTFEEKLLLERRREFAIESKRWQDLLRFGVAAETMESHFANPQITASDIRLLYPIPQREIDAAPGLIIQNNY
ncbi:MAG: RagB/SusD family nutrient uptake outer membrane protein [Balneolaceae bacterium]